jgi:hypothetical protein
MLIALPLTAAALAMHGSSPPPPRPKPGVVPGAGHGSRGGGFLSRVGPRRYLLAMSKDASWNPILRF